jgi:hypothetical protein
MIDPNYRPSDEIMFETAMKLNKYPYLNKRYQLNPEIKQQILQISEKD